MDAAPTPIVVQNIRAAYSALQYRVQRALQTQLGDRYRLGIHRRECTSLLSDITGHSHLGIIPANEQAVMESGIYDMLDALNSATGASSDQPDGPPASFGARVLSGRPGRPRVDIDPEDLSLLATGRTRNTDLAVMYDCSARTIRRRRLEFGLSAPGDPVFSDEDVSDGRTLRTYHPGRASNLSDLTNDQIDQLVLSIYYQFPSFGRRMLEGYLLELGHRVPRRRLEEAYHRVVGPSTHSFAPRRLVRRTYSVPGPNSLWHHDGQHGLIRWKIVIHAFIDGYSRMVLGIRASNNNLASTVLDLFLAIVNNFGFPSRIRGDHGGENQLVAALQEEVRGVERGSYIHGKSVHNIRIERLWVDVTNGFGSKWKVFFRMLESNHGLDVDKDAHIWLLHFLFLHYINTDADAWMRAWNMHTLSRQGDSHLSPNSLYFRGMAVHGLRGLRPNHAGPTGPNTGSEDATHFSPVGLQDPPILSEQDQMSYGIDWDEFDVTHIVEHHRDRHATDQIDPVSNPFLALDPADMRYVVVPDIRCPFSDYQVEELSTYIVSHLSEEMRSTPDMQARAHAWDLALHYCSNLRDDAFTL